MSCSLILGAMMPVIFFIIILSVSNWFQMTVTVTGIKTAKKCVQMSGVIMSSPSGIAKVKIWSLIGQTFMQEFSLVMQASYSFPLGAMESVGTSIQNREWGLNSHKKVAFKTCAGWGV